MGLLSRDQRAYCYSNPLAIGEIFSDMGRHFKQVDPYGCSLRQRLKCLSARSENPHSSAGFRFLPFESSFLYCSGDGSVVAAPHGSLTISVMLPAFPSSPREASRREAANLHTSPRHFQKLAYKYRHRCNGIPFRSENRVLGPQLRRMVRDVIRRHRQR